MAMRDAGRCAIKHLANGVAHEIVHQRSVAEPDFGFRRMHVHVDFFQIAIEKQQRERIARRRHQVVIRGRNRVQQQAVANQAAVDEQINRIAIHLLHLRAADEAAQAEMPRDRIPWIAIVNRELQIAALIAQIEQIFQHLAAEDLKHALAQRGDRRNVQQIGVVVAQQKALAGCARL